MSDILNEWEKPKSRVNLAPLFEALAKAKAEFPEIKRTRTATVRMKSGGSYSYTYADLADVFSATTPALSAYGLSVMQYPKGHDLHTMITHESGAVFNAEPWPIKPMPTRSLDNAQDFQSAVQVAKRYALTALLGITTEETVEGSMRTGRDLPEQINDRFETGDGIRLPRGAKIERGWEPRRIAEEVARAIRAQFEEPKTQVGLNGVWDRNAAFIEKLRDKHSDLFSDIFDEFQKYMDEAPETPGEARSAAAQQKGEAA